MSRVNLFSFQKLTERKLKGKNNELEQRLVYEAQNKSNSLRRATENSNRSQQLRASESQLNDYRDQLESEPKTNQELTAQLEKTMRQLEFKSNSLVQCEQTLNLLEGKIEGINSENTQLKTENAASLRKQDFLLEKVFELEFSLLELNEEIFLSSTSPQLFEDLNNSHTQLLSDYNSLKSAHSQLAVDYNESSQAFQSVSSKFSILELQHESLLCEYTTLQYEHNTLRNHTEDSAQAEILSLSLERRKLHSLVNELQFQLSEAAASFKETPLSV